MTLALSKNSNGYSLVEFLVATALFALFSAAIVIASLTIVRNSLDSAERTQGIAYAKEGLEAARAIRDRNFLLLKNGTHGISQENSVFVFSGAEDQIDGLFTRTITVEDFQPRLKKIISKVIWKTAGLFDQEISFTGLLGQWQGRDFIQTLKSEFEAGTFENSMARSSTPPPTENGEVALQGVEEDSGFYATALLGYHAHDVAVQGNYAYVTTDRDKEGLAIVDLTDIKNPKTVKTVDIGGKARGIFIEGNYAYIAGQNAQKGLAIVNIENPLLPSLAATVDIGEDAMDLYVSGEILYLTHNKSNAGLKIYSLAHPANPMAMATVDVKGVGRGIRASGGYAYVGVQNSSKGFAVVDVTNPALATYQTSLDVGAEGRGEALQGNYVYLAVDDANKSIVAIDVINPLAPKIVAELDTKAKTVDVAIQGNYLYGGQDSLEHSVAAVTIENPAQPKLSYTLDVNAKGEGVFSTDAYVFIALSSGNEGLAIIGVAGMGYPAQGSYASQTLDSGSGTTEYRSIEWTADVPPGTQAKFQIKTADTLANLANAAWSGSDGTINTYYTVSPSMITLNPQASGKRFLQWKAFLVPSGSASPILESVTVTYEP